MVLMRERNEVLGGRSAELCFVDIGDREESRASAKGSVRPGVLLEDPARTDDPYANGGFHRGPYCNSNLTRSPSWPNQNR
jgi:hypothetical protein